MGVRPATTAAAWTIVLTLAAWATGCAGANLATTPTTPRVHDGIPARTLAGQLGMHLGRAGRYSVAMSGPANSLLITGPPRPGVILNGRRIGNGSGISEQNGRLIVERGLAGEIRRQLRRQPTPQPVVRPAPPIHVPTGATVVLDAGHGGKDPGAANRYGPTESILVMDTVHRVAQRLTQRNVRVVLTRRNDTFIELNERAAIANRVGADLFISIHADSHPSAAIDGFTVYVARQSGKRAKALATRTAESMKRHVPTSRGIRSQDFRVLVKTKMPAILIEMGYLTNRAEGRKLSTAAYRQHLADAIADGIVNDLRNRR